MIAVPLALLAALANATASVLQRHAARAIPAEEAFRPGLIRRLVVNACWLGGIGALIAGFLFQAAALSIGGLALVQPLLVAELPFTMMLAVWLFRRRLDPRSWIAVGALSAGLATFLLAADPAPGDRYPDRPGWLISTALTVGLVVLSVLIAGPAGHPLRPVLLGGAAGLGFAFTAVLMKRAVGVLNRDPAALFVSWPLYAMVTAGLCSLFLLQNALHSGTLVAVQPALTITDPVASTAYGVALFGEEIRTGAWMLPELLAVGLMCYGSVLLARSPAFHGRPPVTEAEGREGSPRRAL